jgi:hypothetical protein
MASHPNWSASAIRSNSLSQFPDRPHDIMIEAAEASSAASRPSGKKGSSWRISYSIGRAGIREIHALAPAAKASDISHDRSSH